MENKILKIENFCLSKENGEVKSITINFLSGKKSERIPWKTKDGIFHLCFKNAFYVFEVNEDEVVNFKFEKLYGPDKKVRLELFVPEQVIIFKDEPLPKTIEVENSKTIEVKKQFESKEKVKHAKYEQIEMCISNNIPVYLVGPAGSGKNHVLEQIAKEKGMNFYFSNSVQQEYKLTGFIDAGGKYHETEFYKAATDFEDCIFFLDELDASIPEVLVLLNAAIANGYFEFPTGKVDISHIHFVAAGNTVGSGADEKYTGRMVIDQATLDRFAIIEFDYDINIEMFLTNGNSQLVSFIRELRANSEDLGVRTTFSYRCLTMVTKLEKSGMNLKDILIIAVFKGLDKDTIRTLDVISENKYKTEMDNIKRAG